MTLIEIENLTFAELKSHRSEAIEAAKAADVGELAARFVDARTDAKQRDEKLGEQGKIIVLLQDSLERAAQQFAEFQRRADAAEQSCTVANNTIAGLRDELAKAREELSLLAKDRDTAVTLAKARRGALAEIMKTIAPLLVQE